HQVGLRPGQRPGGTDIHLVPIDEAGEGVCPMPPTDLLFLRTRLDDRARLEDERLADEVIRRLLVIKDGQVEKGGAVAGEWESQRLAHPHLWERAERLPQQRVGAPDEVDPRVLDRKGEKVCL